MRTMIKRSLPWIFVLLLPFAAIAQKKREIIPRDSITGKYTYEGIEQVEGADLEALRARLEKWSKQHFNPEESEYASVVRDGDSYVLHDREALPGKARKFIEYDLTIDLKDDRYRYKLGKIEYIAVGKYPLEDKMATDKRSDLEEIHVICSNILASLKASMTKGDDW